MNKQLNWFKTLFQIEVEHLKEYSEITDNTLKKELENFQAFVDKEVSGLSEDEQGEFYEYYVDDYWKYSKVLPNLSRSSIFLLFYTFFEHKLYLLAEKLSLEKKNKLTQKDISGQGIERTKIYFEKVLDINFPSDTKEWERLQNYGRIRNLIAHNGSKVKKGDSKTLISFSKSVNNFSISDLSDITLEENFLSDFLKDVQELFNKIYSNI